MVSPSFASNILPVYLLLVTNTTNHSQLMIVSGLVSYSLVKLVHPFTSI